MSRGGCFQAREGQVMWKHPIPGEDLTVLAFDADDTLWHNETIFRLSEERFRQLLQDEVEQDVLEQALLETERKNIRFYGYGIKGFTLSMIETALEVTGGQVSPRVIAEILAVGREMLTHPLECLPGVRSTLEELSQRYRLVLITKGDLFDQERKVAESGLGELFVAVEIVSEKSEQTYRQAFARHGRGPESALMVGNSLKSDVIPALKAGAWGVYIPYQVTWALERAEEPQDQPRYRRLDQLSELPSLLVQEKSRESRTRLI